MRPPAAKAWNTIFDAATTADDRPLPSDAQVIGAVQRAMVRRPV
jgi:hypothetical protein